MMSLMRITLVISVLIGSTLFFGYWSIGKFNTAFDNISDSYLANTYSAYPLFRQPADLASTSLEISGAFATSTATSTTDKTILVSASATTTATTTRVTATSTGL